MKKFLINSLILSFIVFFFGIIYLSQIGYETKRFNNLVSEKIKEFDDKISLDLKTIKLKLDIKSLTFYLFTKNPEVQYFDVDIPISEINAYTKINSIIKPAIKIEKIFVSTNETKIEDIKKIVKNIKPSNLKSILMNNISTGIIKSKTELLFDDESNLKNFQLDGYVKKLNASFFDNKNINNAKFIFLIEKDKGYLDNFSGKIDNLIIEKGNLQFSHNNKIKILSDFVSKIELDEVKSRQLFKKFVNKKFFDNKIRLNLKARSELDLTLDKTLKLENFSIATNGDIERSYLKPNKSFRTNRY